LRRAAAAKAAAAMVAVCTVTEETQPEQILLPSIFFLSFSPFSLFAPHCTPEPPQSDPHRAMTA
jgi:hypothetical protein